MIWLWLLSALGLAQEPPVTQPNTQAVQEACEGLVGVFGDVIIDKATSVLPDGGWPIAMPRVSTDGPKATFCRVEGRIEGNIGFEMWLPEDWNGRMLGAGVGGPAGAFNYRDMAWRIDQGFATVTTDTGHKAENTRWMSEPKPREDYEHRGVHLTALAAKGLITRHYGRAADRAYFLGCSGGGRQALKELQNYPDDYDGIVSGAPGPNVPLQSVRMLWFALEQQRQPAAALTEADWSLYANSANAHCDPLDGLRDGIVENPAACHFPIETLSCQAGGDENCIPEPRLAMLSSIISPLVDEHGDAMDGGIFTGVRTRPGPPSPLLRALWADGIYDDPAWDEFTFNRTRDLAAVYEKMPELRADRTNITPFVSRGNKAIIYQGWQDPSTNAGPTIDYYSALAAANGGVSDLSENVRLFMVPGMEHCARGVSADMFGGSGQRAPMDDPQGDILWALIDWVEEGNAPASITARGERDGGEGFTRRLCPFPQSAQYQAGEGAASANDFTCRNDPILSGMLK